MIKQILNYKNLEPHILKTIVAEFFLQLINASMMLILLIYMEKRGYEDFESAAFMSFRFLGVLLFAFPLGLFIKGRKIRPLFIVSSILSPILGLLTIYAIEHYIYWFIYLGLFLWGISFTLLQITVLPYILRNAKEETHTEAISLSYATWSIASIAGGLIIFVLKRLNPDLFDEHLILQIICYLSLIGSLFAFSISKKEYVPALKRKRTDLKDFDWFLIIKALVPTLIIAVGAGLTIPFIGLFFYKIHGLDSDKFSLIASFTTVIVFLSVLYVPTIKNKLGYKKAIPTTQSFAIIALIILATTELIPQPYGLVIAIICYMMRQPLMNMAGPMTSDIIMKYVGERNREITSALTAAIWSGSWFISSKIFQYLRSIGFPYIYVFLITAGLYIIGVISYYLLILDFEKKQKANTI